MSTTVNQSQMQAALRTFLLAVLPAGWEVIQGQDNLVPEPKTTSFVTMTIISLIRLETNGHAYAPPPTGVLSPGTATVTQPSQVTFQLDFHSEAPTAASDAAIIASTLFRDEVGYVSLTAGGLPITPLYADDPKQMPFINAEQQYENRWVVGAVMQVDAGVTLDQQFMSGVPTVETFPPADAKKH